MSDMPKKIACMVKRYIAQEVGAIAIMFALMVPILVGVTGMAVDYSMAYLVKQRLAQAIDAAALAAAASSTEESEIKQRVNDFFDANYPPEKLGATIDLDVQIVGDEVQVSATARYHTTFARLLGIEHVDVDADTTVVREVQGIEVVLVMDNTGSMSTNNNISALRNAASNFVYIMYGINPEDGEDADPEDLDSMATRDSDYIKVGLVPYSSSVNVGKYGLGEYPDGSYYSEEFVNNPNNLSYTTYTNSSSGWLGCILAHDYPDDTIDHEGPWDMYRYCRDEDDDPYCRINKYGKVSQKPNYNCVRTPIMPLSTSPSDLKERIDTMVAHGYTLGNYGMVWGGRVLSEDFPFEEGVAWSNEYWRKAIVMMTDGVNTMENYYTAYGATKDHNINPNDLNERFAEVCDDLKEKGAIIYTVTFYSNVSASTKEYYKACATSEDYYHDAPSQDDLVDVFETISRELSNLHIKE